MSVVIAPARGPLRIVRVALALGLAAAFTASLRRLDAARTWDALAAVRGEWLLAAALCYLAILPLWAWQWHLLAPRSRTQTFARMLRVVTTTSAVLNTTPLLVGEATGIVLLVTVAGLDRAAAVSVLAMDQLLVGIAKLVVLASAALLAPLPAWMSRAILGLVAGVGALGAVMLFAASRGALHVANDDSASPRARSMRATLSRALAALPSALAPLRSPRRGGGALLLALVKKAVEVGAMLCVQRAFGLDLPLGSAVLALGMLNLATLLPLVPGNVGVYEGAVVLAYTRFGLPTGPALGIAAVQHLCYLVALAAPGVVWSVAQRLSSATDRSNG